ncbi:MAG: hypothetical protein ERJ69_06700 [Aphanocapsa feldmannii 288cV]|nr:MAG: hypothetical protein ERJ69_06700 [Aphanocapsa feldmannii 288cV]
MDQRTLVQAIGFGSVALSGILISVVIAKHPVASPKPHIRTAQENLAEIKLICIRNLAEKAAFVSDKNKDDKGNVKNQIVESYEKSLNNLINWSKNIYADGVSHGFTQLCTTLSFVEGGVGDEWDAYGRWIP